MPVRTLKNKADRVKVVRWIRSGAPLHEGVLLYASLMPDPKLLSALKRNPSANAETMNMDFCMMMGITKEKFHSIIKEYHGKTSKNSKYPNADSSHSRVRRNERRIRNLDEKRHENQSTKRSFRSEWPFLSRPECPPQLKALAADKISAWERYTAAHKKLFDCSTLEECHEVAHSLIEDFKENRMIHDELEYYKQHGATLGQHPIWKQYDRFKSLNGMNVIELVRLHDKTLPHRIWRIESELKKGDKPHLQGEREQRLKEVQAELAEVKRILGIHG